MGETQTLYGLPGRETPKRITHDLVSKNNSPIRSITVIRRPQSNGWRIRGGKEERRKRRNE